QRVSSLLIKVPNKIGQRLVAQWSPKQPFRSITVCRHVHIESLEKYQLQKGKHGSGLMPALKRCKQQQSKLATAAQMLSWSSAVTHRSPVISALPQLPWLAIAQSEPGAEYRCSPETPGDS